MTVGLHVNCISCGLTARARINFDDPRGSRIASEVCAADAYKAEVRRHLLPFSITTCFSGLCAELVRLVGCNPKVVMAGGK